MIGKSISILSSKACALPLNLGNWASCVRQGVDVQDQLGTEWAHDILRRLYTLFLP